MCMCTASHVGLFVTPCTAALQSPLHGIFQARILEWVTISYPGIEPASLESPAWQADSLPLVPPGKTLSFPQ